MSVQQTIQSAMYSDIDDLTAIIRRMQLQRGVCRSDGIALEAHIALPSSIRQYTEAPSRTQYDRTLAIAKAKRANLRRDLYSMESHAVLARPNMPMKELCASMEAITGRHFLLFGGVLAMIAVLLKFFGVDGGGSGGGGGGGATAKVASVKLTAAVADLEKYVADVQKQVSATHKPNAVHPIVTTYTKSTNPVNYVADNHAELVVFAEQVSLNIHAMLHGAIPDDALGKVLESPATMGAYLLDENDVMVVCCKRYIEPKIVRLDGSDEQKLFNEFVVSMGGWLDRRLDFVEEFLTDIAQGVIHTSQQAETLVKNTNVLEQVPPSIMSDGLPSSHNAAILAAVATMRTADAEIKLGETPARRTAGIRALSDILGLVGKKMEEVLYSPITMADVSGETIMKIVDEAITIPVNALADDVDHYTNRIKTLSDLQRQLIDADRQLAEKHEFHREHATPEQLADMAAIRYVNTSLSFIVKQMFKATQYMHGKATMSQNVEKYIRSYKAALTAYLRLYNAL